MDEFLKQCKKRLEEALNNDLMENMRFDYEAFQENIFSLEQEINQYDPYDPDAEQIRDLIAQVKNQYNMFDPDVEREIMFPNGDYDEDEL